MDYTLELIVVPVTDMDRAKAFYSENAGFNVDVDFSAGEDFRIVQLTPRGSACAITIMRQPERAGAVQGLHLCVEDIEAARQELVSQGVDAGQLWHMADGVQTNGPHPKRENYGTFFAFEDPDGNGWLVQEKKKG